MPRQTGSRVSARRRLILNVELEEERETGRWIAEVVDMPGVMVYGDNKVEAFRRAQALAFEVLADRLKNGEDPLTGRPSRPRPIDGVRFASVRQTALAR